MMMMIPLSPISLRHFAAQQLKDACQPVFRGRRDKGPPAETRTPIPHFFVDPPSLRVLQVPASPGLRWCGSQAKARRERDQPAYVANTYGTGLPPSQLQRRARRMWPARKWVYRVRPSSPSFTSFLFHHSNSKNPNPVQFPILSVYPFGST